MKKKRYAYGEISDAITFKRVLTPEEINLLYNNGKSISLKKCYKDAITKRK